MSSRSESLKRKIPADVLPKRRSFSGARKLMAFPKTTFDVGGGADGSSFHEEDRRGPETRIPSRPFYVANRISLIMRLPHIWPRTKSPTNWGPPSRSPTPFDSGPRRIKDSAFWAITGPRISYPWRIEGSVRGNCIASRTISLEYRIPGQERGTHGSCPRKQVIRKAYSKFDHCSNRCNCSSMSHRPQRNATLRRPPRRRRLIRNFLYRSRIRSNPIGSAPNG